MNRNLIFEKFKLYFPNDVKDVNRWYRNSKDSIRVQMKDKREFVFIYLDDRNWTFETAESYLNQKMKGEK